MPNLYINLRNYKEKIDSISIGSKLLIMWLFTVFFLSVAKFILHRFGIDDGMTRQMVLFAIGTVPLIGFFINIKKLDKRNYKPFFIMLAVIIAAIGITALLNSDVRPFLVRSGYGLDRVLIPNCALYAFLFFSVVDDPESILKDLRLFAWVDFVFLVLVELRPALIDGYWSSIAPSGEMMKFSYSLSFGYDMLIPVCIFAYFVVREKKWIDFIPGIIGYYFVITQGNRGAFGVSLVFVALMGISSIIDAKSSKDKINVVIKIVIIYALISVFLLLLVPKLSSLFYSSDGVEQSIRTVEMAKKGNFTESNGRLDIWALVIDSIKDGGIFGYGFFGDRPTVVKYHYVGFSHNLFLELIASFGIIGAIISVVVIFEAIRMIFFCKEKKWRELFIITFICSCQLMISMSLWYVWPFWATLAIIYKYSCASNTGIIAKINDKKSSRTHTI